jgi:6-hydroxynicotinate 3-monooxygenase
MQGPRIAIVGAGLGGITAGMMLQRAGYNVRVYEQAPQIARVGAGINLGPNVMKVMRHLGLSDTMYDIGLIPESYWSREWDTGRVLFDVPLARYAETFGMPNLIMHRGDLQAVLASALQPGSLVFDRQLVGLDRAGTSTRLTFASGETAEADIVVGADGVNSRVREILQGVQPPTYTGFVAYRAIFPTALLGPERVSSDQAKWWSDERHPADEDRHFISYYLTKAREEIYFVTGSPDPNWEEGVNSVPADMDEVRACYEGFHPEVQRMINACPQASKWPLLERNPLPFWSEGNVVLLGDACHPMKPHMGQGANMAIEDAAILARCIVGAEGEYAEAFRLYEATRIGRTSRVQRESHVNTWMKYETDPSWVYSYDALTTPLGVPPGEETASARAPLAAGAR